MRVILFVFSLLVMSFSQEYSRSLKKKINKDISKVFNINHFSLEKVILEDSIVLNGEISHIKSGNSLGYLYVGKVKICRDGDCDAKLDESQDYEYFKYFILFNKNKKLAKVRVYEYRASYGQEISSGSWLRQFIGNNVNDKFVLGKNIDAMSGATISSQAIVKDINNVSIVLTTIK